MKNKKKLYLIFFIYLATSICITIFCYYVCFSSSIISDETTMLGQVEVKSWRGYPSAFLHDVTRFADESKTQIEFQESQFNTLNFAYDSCFFLLVVGPQVLILVSLLRNGKIQLGLFLLVMSSIIVFTSVLANAVAHAQFLARQREVFQKYRDAVDIHSTGQAPIWTEKLFSYSQQQHLFGSLETSEIVAIEITHQFSDEILAEMVRGLAISKVEICISGYSLDLPVDREVCILNSVNPENLNKVILIGDKGGSGKDILFRNLPKLQNCDELLLSGIDISLEEMSRIISNSKLRILRLNHIDADEFEFRKLACILEANGIKELEVSGCNFDFEYYDGEGSCIKDLNQFAPSVKLITPY